MVNYGIDKNVWKEYTDAPAGSYYWSTYKSTFSNFGFPIIVATAVIALKLN
jgi:hypothetical protein